MLAATAKYLPTIADFDPKNVEITVFSGIDAIINAPYRFRMSEERLYGIHFPSKRGSEMVLAYVNGNPDKPVGLGFVPNAAAPSVARNISCVDNVMRSWGGNELVMNDSHSRENIRLSTPTVRYLELHDGDELARLKSATWNDKNDSVYRSGYLKITDKSVSTFYHGKDLYRSIIKDIPWDLVLWNENGAYAPPTYGNTPKRLPTKMYIFEKNKEPVSKK